MTQHEQPCHTGAAAHVCAVCAEPAINYGCTVCDPQVVTRRPLDMCDEHRAQLNRWLADGKPSP